MALAPSNLQKTGAKKAFLNPYSGNYTTNARSIGPSAPKVYGASTYQQPNSPGGAFPIAQGRPPTNVLSNTMTGTAIPSNPQPQMPNFEDAARQAADAELQGLNTQYDYLRADTEGQLSSLGTQKANTLSSLGTQLEGVRSQVAKSKAESEEQTQKNTQDALSTAQDVERTNRNKLRALGILNSSAAGDILSRPMVEYDKQRSAMLATNQKRLADLDDFMNQKTAEHADAVRQVESQYTDLVGRIQNDLRFNERQRADAIRAANSALQQRIADIQQAQFNYAQQVNTMKQNFAMQLAQQGNYQVPGADMNAILSQIFSLPGKQSPQQVGLSQDELRKRGLLSAVA